MAQPPNPTYTNWNEVTDMKILEFKGCHMGDYLGMQNFAHFATVNGITVHANRARILHSLNSALVPAVTLCSQNKRLPDGMYVSTLDIEFLSRVDAFRAMLTKSQRSINVGGAAAVSGQAAQDSLRSDETVFASFIQYIRQATNYADARELERRQGLIWQ